ncbi:MAG: T6SS amidase immunity protein Tai4 family protein [Xanthobacteraceae bacterium]
MDFKVNAFAALVLLIGPSAVDAKDTNVPVQYSAAEYLKNFALSVCISHGYQSEEVVKDSSAVAGGYFQRGSLPIEAYEEAEALAKGFLSKEYVGMHGGKFTLMKCIDVFNSKELEWLIQKYSKK